MRNFFRNIIWILCIFFISIFHLKGQTDYQTGLPFIKNYSFEGQKFSLQNWSIAQDNNGIMYFADSDGVLIYDGVTWELFKLPNNINARSLVSDSLGVIYVGTTRQFGYLKNNQEGKLEYISLSDSLSEINFEEIWKVFSTINGIYFIAGRKYIYHFHNNKLKKVYIPSKISKFRAFQVNDDIYTVDDEKGIFKLVDDTLKNLYQGKSVCSKSVYVMLPFENNKILLGTRNDGFYLYSPTDTINKKNYIDQLSNNFNEDKSITKFKTQIDDYFIDSHIYTGNLLSNGNCVITTLKKGCVIITPKGNLVKIFDKTIGLPTNSIYYSYQDNQGNLWLATEKGVSKIDLNSPITQFNEKNGVSGSIQSLYYFKKRLFVGTSSGMFYLPKLDSNNLVNNYSLLPLSTKYIYNLEHSKIKLNNKEILLAGTLRDLVYVKDDLTVKLLKKMYACFSICQSVRKPNRVFLGNSNGLSSMTLTLDINNNLIFNDKDAIKGLNENIQLITTDKKGCLWISTSLNGIIYLRFNKEEDLSNYKAFYYDTSHGLPDMHNCRVYLIDNKIVISSEKGLYTIKDTTVNPNDYKFVSLNAYGLNYSIDSLSIERIFIDKQNNKWFNTIQKGICLYNDSLKKLITAPFKRIAKNLFENIFVDDNGIAWFFSVNTLFRFDKNLKYSIDCKYNPIIKKVTIAKDSTIYNGFQRNNHKIVNNTSIKYKNNSIIFKYTYPDYYSEEDNKYKYFLQGFDEDWSEWTSQTKKEYTNLPEGTYYFRVKAKNVYDVESDEAVYEFTVSSPWYRTIFAFIAYFVITIFVIYQIIKIRTLRLRKEKQRLQKGIKIAVEEIEQQKEELRTQTEQLEQSNKELEKLSFIVQETKNAVVLIDAQGNFKWVNPGFTQMYGLTFEQFISKVSTNIKNSNDSPKVNKAINKCFEEKVPVSYEFLTVDAKGERLWAKTTLTPILDKTGNITKVIAIDTDITKLIEAEERIEKQNEKIINQAKILVQVNKELKKMSIVASKTDNAVSLMDGKGNFVWVNAGFSRMYGYTIDELINEKNNIIGIDSNLHINDLINVWFGEKKAIIYETEKITKSDDKIWVQTTLTPILDDNNKVKKLIAIDSDISNIKRAEKQIQQQKDEIQTQRDFALKQRDEISIQKQEIIDSIIYAKRIQAAILPSKKIIDKILSEYFILYKPRDIVSGDFYWVHQKDKKIIITVADCTGHGVPGAFMSIIGASFINEIVNINNIIQPNEILDNLKGKIINSLQQSSRDDSIRDGMDMSICVIDAENNTLNFAGANNSIYIVRDDELIEVSPDKMPVSIYKNITKPFTNHKIKLTKGDLIYMFTDGYADQFGGEKAKKFKYRQFKQMFLQIREAGMFEQKIILDKTIERWAGDLEQVDDILVLGIRYNGK